MESNVLELETCDDTLKFCTIRAMPEFQTLGPKVGKDMGKVSGVSAGCAWADYQG